MSHYRDGSSAKVGDIVRGNTYNKQGIQIGVVYDINPDADSCNCKLATKFATVHVNGVPVLIATEYDYTACRELEKVEAARELTPMDLTLGDPLE